MSLVSLLSNKMWLGYAYFNRLKIVDLQLFDLAEWWEYIRSESITVGICPKKWVKNGRERTPF